MSVWDFADRHPLLATTYVVLVWFLAALWIAGRGKKEERKP